MGNKKAAFAGSLARETRGDSTTSSTQHQRILQMLRAGEPVTVYRLHTVGINSATARIKELRDAGHPIIDRWETMINQYGDEVRYKVYSLAAKGGQA